MIAKARTRTTRFFPIALYRKARRVGVPARDLSDYIRALIRQGATPFQAFGAANEALNATAEL